MTRKFFDYETESKKRLIFPRIHFRSMSRAEGEIGFEFEMIGPFIHSEFHSKSYDVYSDSKTNALIYVIGGDAHCHTEERKGRYQEGIAILCEEKDKKRLIRRITKIK